MALVVEDGTGLSNANSYGSVAEADTYHTDHGNPTTWSGSTTAEKEEALILATQATDLQNHLAWKGTKKSTTQALDWPREGVRDRDGNLLSSTSLPTNLKNSVFELAEIARGLTDPSTLVADANDVTAIVRERIGLGDGALEEDITYSPPKAGGSTSSLRSNPIVQLLLQDLIFPGDKIHLA